MPYANGSLFAEPGRIDLTPEELALLREVSASNWHEVQPSIFGSLLQGVFGHEKQWRLGAHYTHESEIQKIVVPTIVEPWTERIKALSSHKEAKQAQADLLNYVVLDPACGSGNFLYVAYRELRRIEAKLAARAGELARAEGRPAQEGLSAFFPLQNMRGIEIEQFGVDLARVTLWMGHKLAVEELGLDESTLPLADLSGIRRADALRVEWGEANAIIGNPPYHGSQNASDSRQGLRGVAQEPLSRRSQGSLRLLVSARRSRCAPATAPAWSGRTRSARTGRAGRASTT